MTTFAEILLYILLGSFSGLLAGLLGMGGGVFIVPGLYFIFKSVDLNNENIMHIAIGTSLATIIITSFVSTLVHHRSKSVLWDFTGLLVPGVILGTSIGVIVTDVISSHILAKIFGFFAVLIGVYFFIPQIPRFSFQKKTKLHVFSSGGVIGMISSILGIGGGIIAIPILLSYRLSTKNAIATSASLTFFTSIVGTVGYMIAGWNEAFEPHSLGFIYLPAFFIMSLSTIIFAPLGAKLNYYISSSILKKIYSIVVFLVGILMIFSK